MEHRHVPAEFAFERRDLEAVDVEHVQLLAVADVQPDRLARDVVRQRIPAVAERLLQERGRLLDLAAGEGEMGEGHGVQ